MASEAVAPPPIPFVELKKIADDVGHPLAGHPLLCEFESTDSCLRPVKPPLTR